jgi:hypothetical protein
MKETIDDRTVTVDEVDQVVPGGTVVQQFKTRGWSWTFGGGVEAWLGRWVAIYGEGGYLRLKGATVDGSEGQLDDGLTYVVAGLRVHVGR